MSKDRATSKEKIHQADGMVVLFIILVIVVPAWWGNLSGRDVPAAPAVVQDPAEFSQSSIELAEAMIDFAFSVPLFNQLSLEEIQALRQLLVDQEVEMNSIFEGK